MLNYSGAWQYSASYRPLCAVVALNMMPFCYANIWEEKWHLQMQKVVALAPGAFAKLFPLTQE